MLYFLRFIFIILIDSFLVIQSATYDIRQRRVVLRMKVPSVHHTMMADDDDDDDDDDCSSE